MFTSSYKLTAMLQTEEEKSSTMLGVVFTDFNESILEMIPARLPAAAGQHRRHRRHADQLLHLIDN